MDREATKLILKITKKEKQDKQSKKATILMIIVEWATKMKFTKQQRATFIIVWSFIIIK